MPLSYRRPGVYLEESLLVNPAETSGAVTVAAFVGCAAQGPINSPTLVESWSDYVTLFGSFGSFAVPNEAPRWLSPTPCHTCLSPSTRSSRTVGESPTSSGLSRLMRPRPVTAASVVVTGEDDQGDPLDAFTISARSVGTWGNTVKYSVARQNPGAEPESVFALQVIVTNRDGVEEVVETYQNLSDEG